MSIGQHLFAVESERTLKSYLYLYMWSDSFGGLYLQKNACRK